MKILLVNASDNDGGAARAAYRLHRALLAEGVDSQMLVQKKVSDDFTVIGPISKVQKGLAAVRPTLDELPVKRYKQRTGTLFSPAWLPFSGVVDRINALKPDVVHLHWIAGGMIKIEDIARVKAPIVWTLHDNWAFTGGCHIMWDCQNYMNTCGKCPRLGSSRVNDLSHKVYTRKKRMLEKKNNIAIVGVSKWIYSCSKKSGLFSSLKNLCIPNPINTEIFSPVDKEVSRNILNLPQKKKLILFGAMSALCDVNKGFRELYQALEKVSTKEVELVVFGAGKPPGGNIFKQRIHYMGRLYDDVTLRILYSSADVMVVPSLQEAFGQTASEAMACGTPVVAFGSTGLLDIVDHEDNGYLAKPFDIGDLAYGIDWILQNKNLDSIKESALNKIRENFDYKVVAPKYIELYRNILSH